MELEVIIMTGLSNKTSHNKKVGDIMKKTYKCCFCNKKFNNFGNNALPLKEGTCCDICNIKYVIPERLKHFKILQQTTDGIIEKESNQQ